MATKTWTAALFAVAFSMAWLWGVLTVPSFLRSTLVFQLGYLIPQAAIVLLPSGAIAAITLALSKNSITAMKVWWALAILIAAILTIGALQVARHL